MIFFPFICFVLKYNFDKGVKDFQKLKEMGKRHFLFHIFISRTTNLQCNIRLIIIILIDMICMNYDLFFTMPKIKYKKSIQE